MVKESGIEERMIETAMTPKVTSKTTWQHWLGLGAFAFLLLFFWFLGAAMQLAIPVYIAPSIYLLFAIVASLLFLPSILAGYFQSAKIALHIVFLTSIALLWFFPFSSRQPFLRDLYSVQPGMTTAQVKAIMGRYMTGTGWPGNPFPGKHQPPARSRMSVAARPTKQEPVPKVNSKSRAQSLTGTVTKANIIPIGAWCHSRKAA